MLCYSAGTFNEIIDLTNAIFKKLTLSDYHKELLVLQVAAHQGNTYEWEQHVTISQAAGVRPDQFIAIAEERFDDADAFKPNERVLLRFGKTIHELGKAPAVVFKHALEHFSIEELSDAMIVIRILSPPVDLHPDLRRSKRRASGRQLGQGISQNKENDRHRENKVMANTRTR